MYCYPDAAFVFLNIWHLTKKQSTKKKSFYIGAAEILHHVRRGGGGRWGALITVQQFMSELKCLQRVLKEEVMQHCGKHSPDPFFF